MHGSTYSFLNSTLHILISYIPIHFIISLNKFFISYFSDTTNLWTGGPSVFLCMCNTWNSYPSRDNFFIDLNRLVSKEGRVSSRHFIHKNTKGPPVDSFVVTLKYEIKKMVNKIMKQIGIHRIRIWSGLLKNKQALPCTSFYPISTNNIIEIDGC